MGNTSHFPIITRVWTPEKTVQQSLCFHSSYKMSISITHIFLCSLQPECTLAQLFLYVGWKFIISSKHKTQRRSAWSQSLMGAQGDKPKASNGRTAVILYCSFYVGLPTSIPAICSSVCQCLQAYPAVWATQLLEQTQHMFLILFPCPARERALFYYIAEKMARCT